MKSKKMKILGAVLVLFILATGGVFYYASTKLRPEEIKKMVIIQAQKVFPKAQVELLHVEIGWGLNFKINLEKFVIKALKDNKQIEMMSVDHFVVKVPILAILTGSGTVEIKLDAPLVNYHEFEVGNNWTYAMGDKTGAVDDKKNLAAGDLGNPSDNKKSHEDSSASLGFLSKSKINIKLSDVAVKYFLRDSSKGEIVVSRFLVKGLNFESSTAFELASKAQFTMKDKSSVSFDTMAIGEFNIADLAKNGSVSSVVIVKLNNIIKSGLDWKIPEITTNLNFLLKKDGELSGKIATSFESQNKISADFVMTKAIEIKNLQMEIFLKDVALIMGLDKAIDLSKSKLISSGNIFYGEDKKINAQLGFSVNPGIRYSIDDLNTNTTFEGTFKGADASAKMKVEVLEGQINTVVNAYFNPNEKFDMNKLKPLDIKVVASGLKIPEKLIKAKLWSKKTEEATKTEESKNQAPGESIANAPPINESSAAFPPASIAINWNSINVGGEDFQGSGKIITSAKSIAIDNVNFKFSKGTGKLSQTMMVGKTSSESKFNFEMSNLNLSSFKSFLPPFIENFTGIFTGKVNGVATIFKNNKPPLFDINVLAEAKQGEIKKLNIADYVYPLLSNIPMVKDKIKDKPLKLDGNFETLNLKGHFTHLAYTIMGFDFVGIDKKIQITGSGEIFPDVKSGKMSLMEVNFVDNTGKISDILIKNTGTKILPLKVVGPGFDLKPDYNYTISKLAKGAIKTKGEEKVKELVQKNIEKLVPEAAKDKVKSLLNGFFKKK